MENEQPYFVVKGQPTEKKLYLNSGVSWTIGRAADNSFAFEDLAMSRRHAVVQELKPGKFYIIDLGSRNGSTLNGRRVTTALELRGGDAVGCGETILVFHQPEVKSQLERSVSGDATLALLRRCLTTVLVVDIRDFTVLAREISEDQLAQTIGTWFRELGSIFRRNGCSAEKYIGDAAMAVWLYEGCIPDQKQMRHVMETLLEVQAFTATLHHQFSLPSSLRIGAGVNTGLTAIGNSGPAENPDFSPLGESVNAAFRLESYTKNSGFDVAIGGLAFDCLNVAPHIVTHFEKRLVGLKGYELPTEVYLTSYSKLRDFLTGEP